MSLAVFDLVLITVTLLCLIVLDFEKSDLKNKVNELDKETRVTRTQDKYYKEAIDSLSKHIEQNTYNVRQLSESCSQVNDLDIEIKVCQKDIEHALEMIEDLKAQRSMDILDKLREEDKE